MQSALATGALMLNQSCGSGSTNKPAFEGKPIGLQLYTVRDEIPNGIEPLIEKIAKLGYTHIEIYGYENGLFFGKSPKEFRDIFYKNGLLIPSGHFGGDDFIRGNDDAWKKACEAANILEMEYVVIPYIDESLRNFSNMDDYDKLTERINLAGKISKESGLKFAYHNHDFEFKYDWKNKTSIYQEFLTKTDPELVKMEMDIFWVVFAEGDPVTLFYQNPGRFPLFHVKDLDPITRKNSDLGKGSIDFPGIFKHQKEAGLKYFFVEQENYNVSPLDSIEKNATYVKNSLIV
jgi:sugar phosphate isomerase/epimerase